MTPANCIRCGKQLTRQANYDHRSGVRAGKHSGGPYCSQECYRKDRWTRGPENL